MDKGFDFESKIRALEHAKVELPRVLAHTGELFFQRNFDKAQWDGESWVPRKDTKNTHAMLVKTGKMRQAMQNTTKCYNWDAITWAVKDVPYSGYINDGTDNMPARHIIGTNKELEAEFMKKIDQQMMRVLNT